MTFSAFITRVYSRIPGKHSQSLAQVRDLAVQQLAELSPRRVGFMETSVELTLPVADPYGGEWAGPGLAGFPLDILEIDGLYSWWGTSTAWGDPLIGPVPVAEVRTALDPNIIVPPLLQARPDRWAWWGGRIWVPKQGADTLLRLDYFRDGTRDQTTGVKIAANSTTETNGWLEEGANALEYAVLAAYYALPTSQNTEQVSICNAQANAYLGNLETRTRLLTGSSSQAPMCF